MKEGNTDKHNNNNRTKKSYCERKGKICCFHTTIKILKPEKKTNILRLNEFIV